MRSRSSAFRPSVLDLYISILQSFASATLEMMEGRTVHSSLSVGLTYRWASRLTSVDFPDLTGPTTSMMNEPFLYSSDLRLSCPSFPLMFSSVSRGVNSDASTPNCAEMDSIFFKFAFSLILLMMMNGTKIGIFLGKSKTSFVFSVHLDKFLRSGKNIRILSLRLIKKLH